MRARWWGAQGFGTSTKPTFWDSVGYAPGLAPSRYAILSSPAHFGPLSRPGYWLPENLSNPPLTQPMHRSDDRLLVIEDDHRIRCELMEAMNQEGFDTQVAVSLKDARVALETSFGAVIVDLGLPDGNGLDLVRELRAKGRGLPILILTARDAPEERVQGLEAGADDYVVKPFHLPELIARIKNLLRRSGRTFGSGPIHYADLVVDPEARTAQRAGKSLTLKPREFELLLFLVQHPGKTFTRDQLLDEIWGNDYKGDARTVDLHVRRVRTRIEDDPGDPHLIHTVWGVGYRMSDSAASD